MVDKTKYVKRFKDLYKKKSGVSISDEMALEYFEKLIALVETVTGHVSINKLITQKDGHR